MKIFVSIASYRDPLLWSTVSDCINNAKFPHNIRFGIVDQSDTAYDVKNHPYSKQISYFHFNSSYSRGPCWARSISNALYNNEDFILQIDAHTVFDKNWDEALINSLQQCLRLSPKCIISSYPLSFEIINSNIVKNKRPNMALVFKPAREAVIKEDNPFITFIGHEIRSDEPILGCHVAGGFIFGPGHFFQEVPYDPTIYFSGEEQNIAIRAWTKGWDIYQIPDVPLFHLYYKHANRPLHWDHEDDKNRPTRWTELKDISQQRLCDLFFNQKNLGVYGLGSTRTLHDFAEFSGINYIDRTIRRVNNV